MQSDNPAQCHFELATSTHFVGSPRPSIHPSPHPHALPAAFYLATSNEIVGHDCAVSQSVSQSVS